MNGFCRRKSLGCPFLAVTSATLRESHAAAKRDCPRPTGQPGCSSTRVHSTLRERSCLLRENLTATPSRAPCALPRVVPDVARAHEHRGRARSNSGGGRASGTPPNTSEWRAERPAGGRGSPRTERDIS